jgi:hypothetical protein
MFAVELHRLLADQERGVVVRGIELSIAHRPGKTVECSI